MAGKSLATFDPLPVHLEILSASRNQTFTCCHRLPALPLRRHWLIGTRFLGEMRWTRGTHARAPRPLDWVAKGRQRANQRMPAYQGAQPQKFVAEIAGQEQPRRQELLSSTHVSVPTYSDQPFRLIPISCSG
jgi:hypothetical protein